jgi:hypothetical protein
MLANYNVIPLNFEYAQQPSVEFLPTKRMTETWAARLFLHRVERGLCGSAIPFRQQHLPG